MVTKTFVVSSEVTQTARTILESAAFQLLTSVGCRNVHMGALPPNLSTWEEVESFLRTRKAITSPGNQSDKEGWFISRSGITVPSLRATRTQYNEMHVMVINGYGWKSTFSATEDYYQDLGEEIKRVILKNPFLLSNDESQGGLTIGELVSPTVNWALLETVGDEMLYKTVISYQHEIHVTEPSGRN